MITMISIMPWVSFPEQTDSKMTICLMYCSVNISEPEHLKPPVEAETDTEEEQVTSNMTGERGSRSAVDRDRVVSVVQILLSLLSLTFF